MADIERKIIALVKRAQFVLEFESELTLKIIVDKAKFPTDSNAASLNENILYVNKDWIDRGLTNKDETDLRFIIYHEVRHAYQKMQIELWKNRQKTREEIDRIIRWDYEMNNYQSNVNENIAYYRQEIEVDANAFAILMFSFDIEKGVKNISGDLTCIHPQVSDLLDNRIAELKKKLDYRVKNIDNRKLQQYN